MVPRVETMRDRRRFHNNEDMLFRWPAAAVIPTSVEPTQHPMIIVITELDVKDVTMSIGIGSAMITVGSRWAILVASLRIMGSRVLSIHKYVDSDVRRDERALMTKDSLLLLPRDVYCNVLDGVVPLRPAIAALREHDE